MKCGAFLLFSALVLHAQSTFEIRGTVSEPGLGGIAGAEVRGTLMAPEGTEFKAVTNPRGEFLIQTEKPGRYQFVATLSGYAPAQGPFEGLYAAMVDDAHPAADVQIAMVRPGDIRGRVLDMDTQEPIEGIEIVAVHRRVYVVLGAIPINVSNDMGPDYFSQHKTDRDGNFTYKQMLPGEYIAAPKGPDLPEFSAGFSTEELKIVDEVYSIPSGDPMVRLNSGGFASFGNILMKKTPRYRAHVSLPQGDCPAGESVRIALLKRGGGPSRERRIGADAFACGSEVLIRNVEPGSYVLYAVSDWQGERDNIESAVWGTASLEVVDQNVETSIALQRGVVLEGQLVAAEGLVILPERLNISTQPLEVIDGARPAAEQFIEWGTDGKFRMSVAARPLTISANARGVYVKQVRYNGIALPDMTIPMNPGTPVHRVELVIDDKFGSLKGTVGEGDQPVPQSIVIFQREGSNGREGLPAEDGTFSSAPLMPGEYRIQAVRREPTMELPALGADAQKVTVRPGDATTIHVRLAGASR